MTSLWLATSPVRATGTAFEPGGSYDTAVIGAGITGVTTALLLARAGQRVVLIEARTPGAVATGNTTGKLSLLQGSTLSRVRQHQGDDILKAHVTANLVAQDWLVAYFGERGIPYQVRSAYSYATTDAGHRTLEREFAATQLAGLDTSWNLDPGLPFDVTASISLAEQVQFHPMELLAAMLDEYESLGGVLHVGCRLPGRQGQPVLRGLDLVGQPPGGASGARDGHAGPRQGRLLREVEAAAVVRGGLPGHRARARGDVPVRRRADPIAAYGADLGGRVLHHRRQRAPRRPRLPHRARVPGPRALDRSVLPDRLVHPCLVGAGLPADQRRPVRGHARLERRPGGDRDRVRQVGHDQRRRRGAAPRRRADGCAPGVGRAAEEPAAARRLARRRVRAQRGGRRPHGRRLGRCRHPPHARRPARGGPGRRRAGRGPASRRGPPSTAGPVRSRPSVRTWAAC